MTESALVSSLWLHQHLDAKNLVILDATFFLPRQKRDSRREYHQHIPGAQFFDIDQVADLSNPLPHSLPPAEQFARQVGALGIDNKTRVVIYDNNHFFAAARVWWMFRVFGHDRVKVLDGGLTAWLKSGFPVETEIPQPVSKNFVAHYQPKLFFDLKQMRDAQATASRQIVDARSEDSFLGLRALSDPELLPGHIPGSINIPYAGLTDPEQLTLLTNDHLNKLFTDAQVDLSLPIVSSCGSGVSAAVLALALFQLGVTEVPLYDGSWAEWGRNPETPKCTQMK